MCSGGRLILIDPTAIIDCHAELAEGVSIGAFSVICAEVKIDKGTVIGPHEIGRAHV